MKIYPKKCIFFKRILTLPTWGLKYLVLKRELFLSGKCDLGHPVHDHKKGKNYPAYLKWFQLEHLPKSHSYSKIWPNFGQK